MPTHRRSVESTESFPLGPAEVYAVGENGIYEVVEHVCDACERPTLAPVFGRAGRVICTPCIVDCVLGLEASRAAG